MGHRVDLAAPAAGYDMPVSRGEPDGEARGGPVRVEGRLVVVELVEDEVVAVARPRKCALDAPEDAGPCAEMTRGRPPPGENTMGTSPPGPLR